MKKKPMVGLKFGRLLVVEETTVLNTQGQPKFRCVCDCGQERLVIGGRLRNGDQVSCGCYREDSKTKHGMYKSRTYKIWCGMKNRTTNESASGSKNYLGRGIKVCDRWQEFENFLEDMGECPSKMTIDRIDNDGDYKKENCRWATQAAQMRNMRRNRMIEFQGKQMCVTDACEIAGVQRHNAYYRLKTGKDIFGNHI